MAAFRGLKPYPKGNPCPCESGLTYGDCCVGKRFRFKVDQKENVIRELKVHPELKPVLEDAFQEFKKMFGRKPGRGDPIAFNHHLTGEEDFWQQARAVGKAANAPEEFIFAWRRSGLIVGEHSKHLLPDSDLEEWNEAIDEYFLLKEEGHDPFFVFTYLSGPEFEKYKHLVKLIDHVIIVLGFSVTNPKRLDSSASYFSYLLLNRSIRSLRTIREMYDTRYDDDCLAIARAVYEVYLRIKLLRREPANSDRFEAILAHESGAFPTKLKKNGQPNYGVCVDPKTGREFVIAIANSETLKVSDFPLDTPLYYDLYPLLSGHVHPDFAQNALNTVAASRSDSPYTGDSIRAIVLILTICTLLMREVSRCTFLRKQPKRDLLHVVKQLGKAVANFIATETILKRREIPSSVYELFEIYNSQGG